MRILVTGVTGFVGSHLAEWALAQGAAVVGSVRWRSTTEHIDHLRDRLTLIGADLRDLSSVRLLLEQARPDYIVHLAAQSFVGASWEAPSETLLTNAISQMNLFEAIRQLGATATRFLVIGSSEEYGLVYPDELPIRETNPLRPLSPYAVSKVTQDLMGYQYFKSYGLDIVRARAFNHSVGRHTPVLLRDDRTGLIDIRYIGELRRYKPAGYLSGQRLDDGTTVWDMRRHPLSVWADGTWSKIAHLSCHSLHSDDRVIRLVASGGIVEVTGEHSVMAPAQAGRVAISASRLALGDRVAMVAMPSSSGMWVHEDVAWLLGFFVAEGCITNGKVRIDNKDRKALERCAEIFLQHFGLDTYFVEGAADVWRLTMRKPEVFAEWLRPQVYASDRNKRVPRSILNAQTDAKLAFLRGYNEGDGLKAGHGIDEFKSFKTKSPILVLGLCYLVANTTRQRMCLNTEVCSAGTYYQMNLNSPIAGHEAWGRHLQVPDDVIKKIEAVPYEGEVWDFETEDHVFHAGLGGNLVHNTGPRRGEAFATSSFAKQIAEAEAGLREPFVSVGDLKPTRDFSDVRDIVQGYWTLLERGTAGEVYNLCSGVDWSIERMLNFLMSQSTLDRIEIRPDPARLRPSDVPVLRGSAEKIHQAVGWRPRIPLEQTLSDLLEYWRAQIRRRPR